jgi:molybdopterin-containing oxidoreductase family iron-sulfur binding subunit
MSDMRGSGQRYWRSLDELADKPEFKQWLHREFPEGASEMLEAGSRRTLLKLMAASFGLAGLTACSRPEQHILPQAKGVEDFIPGNPMRYATAMTLGGVAHGLVVEAHDGRPTKVEGNPRHPSSLGAASTYRRRRCSTSMILIVPKPCCATETDRTGRISRRSSVTTSSPTTSATAAASGY